ncbi:ABC transporter permease [Lacibacterium aquatile]|uniref:ABC transporter permease n=1 Tax=Lacibacterium aquatile TaxID=1168082 RepID=A0ABW5DTK5_9PROT
MRLDLIPRQSTPAWAIYGTPILAIFLTVVAGAILFAILGFNPWQALHGFFIDPISTEYGLTELGVKATPLALIAVGLSIGFRAGVWNIGAEGQLTVGAICAGGVALAFWGDEGWWTLPLMLMAGLAGGAAYAAIPAFLRTRFHANEILVSLMMTYVAQLWLALLVQGPWRDPQGYNFPQSRMFGADSLLPVLVEGSRLHLGALAALLVVAAATVLLSRAFIGYQVKVIGLAPAAASFAGFSAKKIIWFCLLVSGALAGLAGMIEVSGPIGQLMPSVSPGYGFTAIIVAFLGRLNPIGILLAALLLALSYLGGENVQVTMRLPLAAASVFQGMLLFFLLGTDVLLRYRPRLVFAKGKAA